MPLLTQSQLLTSFADNSSGNISPGNMRDFVNASQVDDTQALLSNVTITDGATVFGGAGTTFNTPATFVGNTTLESSLFMYGHMIFANGGALSIDLNNSLIKFDSSSSVSADGSGNLTFTANSITGPFPGGGGGGWVGTATSDLHMQSYAVYFDADSVMQAQGTGSVALNASGQVAINASSLNVTCSGIFSINAAINITGGALTMIDGAINMNDNALNVDAASKIQGDGSGNLSITANSVNISGPLNMRGGSGSNGINLDNLPIRFDSASSVSADGAGHLTFTANSITGPFPTGWDGNATSDLQLSNDYGIFGANVISMAGPMYMNTQPIFFDDTANSFIYGGSGDLFIDALTTYITNGAVWLGPTYLDGSSVLSADGFGVVNLTAYTINLNASNVGTGQITLNGTGNLIFNSGYIIFGNGASISTNTEAGQGMTLSGTGTLDLSSFSGIVGPTIASALQGDAVGDINMMGFQFSLDGSSYIQADGSGDITVNSTGSGNITIEATNAILITSTNLELIATVNMNGHIDMNNNNIMNASVMNASAMYATTFAGSQVLVKAAVYTSGSIGSSASFPPCSLIGIGSISGHGMSGGVINFQGCLNFQADQDGMGSGVSISDPSSASGYIAIRVQGSTFYFGYYK
jgi:fibronectin-binding autotransporter adhesin